MTTVEFMSAASRRSVGLLAILAGLLVFLLGARPATAQALPVCTPGGTLAIQLVIDDSGSMSSNDPSDLRAAAASLVINQLPNADIVGTILFSDSATVLFAPTALDTLNRPALEQSVFERSPSFGGTEYAPAFSLAREQVAIAGADRSAVIFLSDGEPFDSDQTEHLNIGAPVFTVGLGGDTTDVLEPIATATGGRHFAARDAADIQNAFATIVSAVRCEAQAGVFDDFLHPGEVAEHPIDVPPTAAELRATATWARGDFLVELIEPTGTPRYGPVGPYPAGIVYTKADTFVTFGAVNPTVGGWRIRIEALPATPLEGVRVTSQITFRDGRTTPPPPVGPPLVEPIPPPPPPLAPPPFAPQPVTRAVVFVPGLRSSQPFSDPGTLDGCTIPGTWNGMAAEAQRELAGLYQVFLAPAERSRLTPDCRGVRAATTDLMHINTTRHADQDVNGRALLIFLAHLRRHYGITDVWLVGHSYGGIWSRSALTRLADGSRPAVRINGIISVGTPHSGSFAADFVDDLGSSCFLPTNQARAIACAAATGARTYFGPALDGLTAASLQAWNRNQTNQARWGCVPVATIAGTGIGIDLNRFGVPADYITPNDTVVGRRSALGGDAGISWRLPQEARDVVHVALPGPLSGLRVMTTDAQVRADIVRLLRRPPPARALCGGTSMAQSPPPEGARSHAVQVADQRPAMRSRSVRVAFVASSGGRRGSGSIARPGQGESLVLVEGAVAFCAGVRVPSIPLLGLQDLQVTGDRPCPNGPLRIRATKPGAGAAAIGRTRGGVTLTTPGRGRLGLSLYGLSKGNRASVRVITLSGRRVAAARLVAGQRTQLRIRPGRYRVTVMRLGVRQALQSTVRV